jgi:hypothetical protein
MKKKWIFVLGPIALVAFIFVGGEVVMQLWNWLLPTLVGWHQVTFWQAIGVLALCRILFGGFGGHGNGRGKWGRPRPQLWEKMTPEEREKFKQDMRSRCGGFGAPTEGTNPST